MMKHIFYFFFLIGALLGGNSLQAQGQAQEDLWFEGMVRLDNGEVIEGDLSYYSNEKTGLLQINTGERILSFDANQIISFSFFDDRLEMHRQFYSLPYKVQDQNYDVNLFFEATYESPHISVLSKTIFRSETRSTNYNPRYRGYYIPSWYNDPYTPRTFSVMVPYETLYLVTPESSIESYSEATPLTSHRIRYRKADYGLLLNMMKDKRGAIEKFVDTNKLDPRQKVDLIRVVQYYNSLKQEANQ
jgi:hypothetical protein